MPVAGGGFEQCYNAQAAVAAGSLLVGRSDSVNFRFVASTTCGEWSLVRNREISRRNRSQQAFAPMVFDASQGNHSTNPTVGLFPRIMLENCFLLRVKVARHDDFSRDTIAKSADIPDTVSARLAKCLNALMESAPHLSQREAMETVLKRDPESAAILKRETSSSSSSTKTDVMGSASARKRMGERVGVSKAADDAVSRLQTIIDRLVASGMDGKQAEFRAKQANPELWEMAVGAPDDAESLEPASSNYMPRTR
jgi:hypothetical protein